MDQGIKSAMLAMQAIQVGDADVIIAGGMENMSLAPYLLPKARTGYRMGNGQLVDSMVNDGLWDVYNNIHMGNCAELCAKDRKYSREEQDAFAIESYKRAQAAMKNGSFDAEISPVEIQQRKGDPIIVNKMKNRVGRTLIKFQCYVRLSIKTEQLRLPMLPKSMMGQQQC